MTTVDVFYVTALRKGETLDEAAINAAKIHAAATGTAESPNVAGTVRQDLAKFFDRSHAERYAAMSVGNGWFSVQVEPRIERLEDQHESHKDVVAKMAAKPSVKSDAPQSEHWQHVGFASRPRDLSPAVQELVDKAAKPR